MTQITMHRDTVVLHESYRRTTGTAQAAPPQLVCSSWCMEHLGVKPLSMSDAVSRRARAAACACHCERTVAPSASELGAALTQKFDIYVAPADSLHTTVCTAYALSYSEKKDKRARSVRSRRSSALHGKHSVCQKLRTYPGIRSSD